MIKKYHSAFVLVGKTAPTANILFPPSPHPPYGGGSGAQLAAICEKACYSQKAKRNLGREAATNRKSFCVNNAIGFWPSF